MTDQKPESRKSPVVGEPTMCDECLPTIEEVLHDPTASNWLKHALRSALERDPVDAANEAEVLARLLCRRCQHILSPTDGSEM